MATMKSITARGTRLEQLKALAKVLATGIDACKDCRALPQLTKQYRETIREIEEIEKSRFGITVLFFDKLPVTERHLLSAILCRHTYILLYARNLAIHGGSMPERSRRPIIRQGCPFIKTALHTVDAIPVVERIETQFEPYIEHNPRQHKRKDRTHSGWKETSAPVGF